MVAKLYTKWLPISYGATFSSEKITLFMVSRFRRFREGMLNLFTNIWRDSKYYLYVIISIMWQNTKFNQLGILLLKLQFRGYYLSHFLFKLYIEISCWGVELICKMKEKENHTHCKQMNRAKSTVNSKVNLLSNEIDKLFQRKFRLLF